MNLQKSFKLTAVALAIASSSSVMADQFTFVDTDDVQTGNVYNTYVLDTDALNTVTANTITVNNQLILAGQDVGAAITQEINDRAAADLTLQANIDTEAATRSAADTQLQANIDTEAATRAAADTALNTRVDTEAATRAAADTAITDGIAAGVTTDSLTVNGPSQLNGNLTVNGGTSTILTAAPATTGADLVIPTVNAAFANTTQPFSQNRDDTQDQTRSVDSQIIDQNKFKLNTSVQTGQQSWTTSQTASAQYDANGVIIPGSLTGPVLGATVDNGFTASSVNQIQDLVLGRNNATEDYQLSISKTDNGVTNSTTVNAFGISTDQITLAGQDLATTLATEAATRSAADTQLQANIDTEAATRAAADTALNTRVDQEVSDRIAGDAATLASANATTASTAATLRGEAAAESARLDQSIVAGDAATLASANATTATTAATLRSEATAEFARVNQAMVSGDAATLSSAKTYADAGDTATLASANTYTNSRVNQLNSRVDDVEKTSYRGIAIALAAQQQIPNIGAGQFAVFGGVGHYEGESAGAIGVASVFADGRTSVSAALGFAGGSEVGGRVGVSYVFGGK